MFVKKYFWIEKIKKDAKETINLSSVIKNISFDNGSLKLMMHFGPKRNVKPTQVIREIFKLPEKDVETFSIHKVALYIQKAGRKSFEP